MSDVQSSPGRPTASAGLSTLGDEAVDLLARLQSRIESLRNGSDESRRLARDLQALLDDLRRFLIAL